MQTYGSGQPLVMLHGWAMHSGLWQDFAKRLAERYRVICVDLPGHGGSHPQRPFNLPQVAERLIAELPAQPCYWLGWSLGGSVATYIAAQYPDRVSRLIVIAGNPCFIGANDWPGMPMAQLENFATQLRQDYAKTLMRFMAGQFNQARQAKKILKALKQAITECRMPDAETLRGGLEILASADLRGLLQQLTIPVLFVLGENDELIPVEVGKALRELSPAMEIQIVKQGGHTPFLTHEALVTEIITHFLES